MQDSVKRHKWLNIKPGVNPVLTCRHHCKGYDYFGMACPGQINGMYCTCMYKAEYDSATHPRPMYECLGQCAPSDAGECKDRVEDGKRVDTNCPGMTINGQLFSEWSGYALGASWRTAYYPYNNKQHLIRLGHIGNFFYH